MTTGENPYRFESEDRYSVITLLPELCDAEWAEYERIGDEVVERLAVQQSPGFLVDLSALDYMGSAMLALIVRIWKSVKDSNGHMVVVNQHEVVHEVLQLAGLDKLWTIVETPDEGLQELGVAGASSRIGLLLVLLGLVALMGAGVGVYLLMNPQHSLDIRIVLGMVFGCSAIGLIAGSVTAVREAGVRRGFGILVVLAALGVLAAGVLNVRGLVDPAAGPQAREPAGREQSGSKKQDAAKQQNGVNKQGGEKNNAAKKNNDPTKS